jgi:tetratricopeptide (TPR) repeat protein
MPYQEVGMVKNATKDAVIALETNGDEASIRLYVTGTYDRLKVSLVDDELVLYNETVAASPATPYLRTIELDKSMSANSLKVIVTDLAKGKELVSYQQETYSEQEVPSPAQAAKRPEEVENNEQLFLTGLHLEQYRHATYVAKDYYEEALRRDAGDVRNNNALGLWYLRRAQFQLAEGFFRKAVATLTQRNPNPYDGEPYYHLGTTLKLTNRNEEAFTAFYKCVWNDGCQHAGYLSLSRIACERGDYEEALGLIEQSLIKNYHSHSARHAKAFILRKLDRREAAQAIIKESLEIDPFNYGCLFESYLLFKITNEEERAEQSLKKLLLVSRNWVHNFIEYAFDYSHAGLFDEASAMLQVHLAATTEQYPMVFYYLGWFAQKQGLIEEAATFYRKAAVADPTMCFPNRIEDVLVLQAAMEANPDDPQAPYYLGNFWYDKRQYENAIQCWETSVQIDDSFPTVHRNLSLAYFNKLSDSTRALASMEKAFSLDSSDARVLMELDQLYKRLNRPHAERLTFLEEHLPLVESRDDLYLERITLCNQLEKYKKAKSLIAGHRFHPWEGGEGKVVGQYLICHLELAKQALEEGDNEKALQLLAEAEHYPENLGEGKLPGAQENDIHYLKGLAYEQMGNEVAAKKYFLAATKGNHEPVQAIFYNDQQPDKIFYQGLAWIKLGYRDKAGAIFQRLIDFGREHLNDHVTIDYFAVSLPDLLVFDVDLNFRNRVHCLYLIALGELGLNTKSSTTIESSFEEVLQLDSNHQGALVHKKMVGFLAPIVS